MSILATDADPHAPVFGGVLIGGKSRRMGRPKHLIRHHGVTWLELTVSRLLEKVERVVISGTGDIPVPLADIPVVQDVPGLKGPLAGVLALLRSDPEASWLVVACDLPGLQAEALDWLLSIRQPEIHAILPDLEANGKLEPLLAYYGAGSRNYLEEIAAGGGLRLSALAGMPGIITPQPPASLHGSWRNINHPYQVEPDI